VSLEITVKNNYFKLSNELRLYCIDFWFSSYGLGKRAINLLKPTGHVMHQQFNIQQLYVLPTLCLCVLYLSENKQRIVPLTA
jgi:hypothetical protein